MLEAAPIHLLKIVYLKKIKREIGVAKMFVCVFKMMFNYQTTSPRNVKRIVKRRKQNPSTQKQI